MKTFEHMPYAHISLSDMLSVGSSNSKGMLFSAGWLHREIATRIAHQKRILQKFEEEMRQAGATKEVPEAVRLTRLLNTIFMDIRRFSKPRTKHEQQAFSEFLDNVLERTMDVNQAVTQGVAAFRLQLLKKGKYSKDLELGLQHFLDSFFLNRIGMNTLIQHHSIFYQQFDTHVSAKSEHVGMIDKSCRVKDIIESAVASATLLCETHYGDSPSVKIVGDADARACAVPAHVHFVVFEVLKNAMRACALKMKELEEVEAEGGEDYDGQVKVQIVSGDEDICIVMQDNGPGFSRGKLMDVWSYLSTTAGYAQVEEQENAIGQPLSIQSMAGYGVGLPLSRLYARIFGGELVLIPVEGAGVTAYYYIPKDGHKKELDEQGGDPPKFW
jgi:pyruvate dehydrogenase kinase 2/3/4